MPKPLKIFLIVAISIISLWIGGRSTGAFQMYNLSTPANEPTLKEGKNFFASSLVRPARFDFICFTGFIPLLNKTELSVYRVCGIAGDTVQIISGDLYVNNILADTNFRLKHFYKISSNSMQDLPQEMLHGENSIIAISADTSLVSLENKWVIQNNFKAAKYMVPDDNGEIANKFSHPWTPDNFGPIQVPPNSYFVLGDNRHNALDSRYRGFISKDSVVATVLWKH